MELAEKSKTAQPGGRFARYFKETLKHAVIVPLVAGMAFFGYVAATGTYQELKDGSGVYRIDTSQKKARVVLPSVREAKENYQRMKTLAEAAADSFNLENPRVVDAIENVYIVIPPSGRENGEYLGLHNPRENKIYVYSAAGRENRNPGKDLRHELLHEYLLKHASREEEAQISTTINGFYKSFPEKFGQYLKEEFFRSGRDVARTLGNMKSKFGLTMDELRDLQDAISVWATVYSLAEDELSVGRKDLNLAAKSEIFAYFGEKAIPEPLVPAYRGILSEKALKNVEPLPQETMDRARAVYEQKIAPNI